MRKFFYCVAIAASVLTSCKDDSFPTADVLSEKAVLEITTNISATRSQIGKSVDSFVSGDEIGLFVSNGSGVNTPYSGLNANKNVRSSFNGTKWTQNPAIYLSPANATIYAYYPYTSSVTDGTQVPIDHASQTDFMFGTPVTGINSGNHKANLKMNHALSLVQFNLKKSNYPGTGKLTSIKISNKASGNFLVSDGKLDIATGTITNGTGRTALTKVTNITIGSGWSASQYPQLLVLPTTPTASAGDIVFTFTIDGKDYNWNVPAKTAWEQGKKNTYTITLKGTSIGTDPGDWKVTITPWAPGKNASGEIG